MIGNDNGVTIQLKKSKSGPRIGIVLSAPSSGPPLATAVAISASVVSVAVVPLAPRNSNVAAPARNAAPCERGPRWSRSHGPSVPLPVDQMAGCSSVMVRASPPASSIVIVLPGRSRCMSRQARSTPAGSAGRPSASDTVSPLPFAIAPTWMPSRMPDRSALPPGHTRATVTRVPATRRTSGGRMTATGRGAASVPITVSPVSASPGPAGHKCGRSTAACSASVTTDAPRMAPTTSRSGGRLIQLRL